MRWLKRPGRWLPFFAEDVFGGQFCIKDSKVYTFDPETGSLGYLADDIEG